MPIEDKQLEAIELLRVIMEEAEIFQQEPGDNTRGWCSELSSYLRGNVGIRCMISKEEFARIIDLINRRST